MNKKCIVCEKEFKPNNPARKYCFKCSPIINGSNGNTAERLKYTNKAWKQEFVRLRGGKCQLCGYSKSIQALEFHHIDPNSKDLVINNAISGNYIQKIEEMKKCALLCANCHREVHYRISSLEDIQFDNKKIDKKLKFLINYNSSNFISCKICGKRISYRATHCRDCSPELKRTVERPEPLQLAKEIVENSFEAVGRKYGVSGNAIKKWCKSYNIPHLKKELETWYQQNKA